METSSAESTRLPENEPCNDKQLSTNEKLRVAIETLLTGKLKDNHDDTLFEKFCSLLQSDLEVSQLVRFITEQGVFELIDAHLPLFENAEYVGKHRDDITAFFRILGALLSHEETFNLYLAVFEEKKKVNKSIFDIGQILGQLIPLFVDKRCEDSSLLVYSMLSFMNNISGHKAGAEWLLHFWFPIENNGYFVDYFVPFSKSEKTHYIQQELYSLLGNLVNFADGSPLFECFCSAFDKHLMNPFSMPECKLAVELLSIIKEGNRKAFIVHRNLNLLAESFLKRCESSGDELICLTKQICLLMSIQSDDEPSVVQLLNSTIAKLRSNSSHCFALASFLGAVINSPLIVDGTKSTRALWFELMSKLLSLMRWHYFGADIDKVDIGNDHDQLAVQAFHSMSYSAFEFNCLRTLNRIDCQLLNVEDVLLLTSTLKPLIGKIQTRKHIIFVLSFFDEAVKTKSDKSVVITEILAIYCEILHKMPPFRCVILKSMRTIFQQSSPLISCEVVLLEKMCPILHYFVEYLTETDHDFEDSELADIIMETIFHLLLHVNLSQISQLGAEKCLDHIKKILEFEITLLGSESVEPSTRANIISSMYSVCRYRFQSPHQLPLPLAETSTFEEQLQSSYDYDCTYRQTLYCNLKSILTQAVPFDSEEARFLLPLLVKFAQEETDTELECILLQIIELTGNALLAELKNDAVAQCFLESGLFTLIHSLLREPLIMYRTKMATLTLHERLCTPLKVHFGPAKADSNNKLDFSRSTAIQEVSPEAAFTFCMNTNGELRQSVEQQRDCPHVSILDDIISTSLAEDMVMDCY